MSICENCKVELDAGMGQCPLCGTPAGTIADTKMRSLAGNVNSRTGVANQKERSLLQRIIWQVTSILLVSGIISTLIIDLGVHRRITWSVYPVTVCMTVFIYVSCFAFLHVRRVLKMLIGLLLSAALFAVLHVALPQADWPLKLALPVLGAINIISTSLIVVIETIRHRGLNLVAYISVAVAALCISIESILSVYNGNFLLRWSVIVAACLLPVTTALLFMHHRIKRNPGMERIFHT